MKTIQLTDPKRIQDIGNLALLKTSLFRYEGEGNVNALVVSSADDSLGIGSIILHTIQ